MTIIQGKDVKLVNHDFKVGYICCRAVVQAVVFDVHSILLTNITPPPPLHLKKHAKPHQSQTHTFTHPSTFASIRYTNYIKHTVTHKNHTHPTLHSLTPQPQPPISCKKPPTYIPTHRPHLQTQDPSPHQSTHLLPHLSAVTDIHDTSSYHNAHTRTNYSDLSIHNLVRYIH